MRYITIKSLSDTIRNNIWKIPRDIDFIIGIPRSGMIAASLISCYLNIPLIDIDSYLAGLPPYGGHRMRHFTNGHERTGKALVIDDTVWNGTAMREVRKKLSGHTETTFIYMCIYLEGRAHDVVDFCLEDVRQYTNNFSTIVLYEWNIFQHNNDHMNEWCFDIDGVLCAEPPDERNESEYLQHIKTANPLFIPRTTIGALVTFRLRKNRAITEQWLKENGVSYNNLYMFEADTWQQRYDSGIRPEKYKADIYRKSNYTLFVESSDYQARRIAESSGKPVIAVETNKLYQ